MSRKIFARSALSVVRFSCKRAGVHVQISNAGLLVCLPVDLLKFSCILSTPPPNLHSTFIFGSAGASPSQAHRINFGSAGTSPSEFFRRARLWRADFVFSAWQEPSPPNPFRRRAEFFLVGQGFIPCRRIFYRRGVKPRPTLS